MRRQCAAISFGGAGANAWLWEIHCCTMRDDLYAAQ